MLKISGLILMYCCTVVSWAATHQTLLDEIKAADETFFKAFNSCNITLMGQIFSKDLEFYHDISGLSDYTTTMQTTKANCARNLGLRRELIDASLSVYPVQGVGAIQKGKHKFCHLENGAMDCGIFEFVHIWKKHNNQWQLYRVISFDHQ